MAPHVPRLSMTLGLSLLLVASATATPFVPLPNVAWTQFPVATSDTSRFGMALDATGEPHFALFRWMDDVATVVYVHRAGPVWIEEIVAPGTSPDIAIDAAGDPHISFVTQPHVTNYARKVNDAWVVEAVDTQGGGADSRIRVDGAGRVHVLFSGLGTHYATRGPSGWVVTTLHNDASFWYGFEIDAAGIAHVTFASSGQMRYLTNKSGTWVASVIPAGGGFPDLALDSTGNVHFAYESFSNTLQYAKLTPTGWTIETVDAGAPTGRWPSIALDSQDRPHITYADRYGTDNALGAKTRYATRSTTGVWTREQVAPLGWTAFESTIAIDEDEFPRVGYYLFETQGVEVYVQRIMLAEPIVRTLVPHGVLP